MLMSIASVLLGATTAFSAAVARRDVSPNFIIHSRLTNYTDFTCANSSLGYLTPKYSYPPGWDAVLHTAKSDALTAYISDARNASNSSLILPAQGSYDELVLILNDLSADNPTGIASLYDAVEFSGTTGLYIDSTGKLGWESDGVSGAWYGCKNWPHEWGLDTALGYKLINATTPSGCVDIDLIVEYV